jgi:hypothetical protein
VKANIAAAKQLCEDGGDWERKNKLKVLTCYFFGKCFCLGFKTDSPLGSSGAGVCCFVTLS